MKMKQKIRLAVGLFWGAMLFCGLFWMASYFFQFGFAEGKMHLQMALEARREYAPFLFVFLFTFRVLFFLPPLFLIFLSVALFPTSEAFLLSLLGQILSVCVLYGLVSFLGKEFVATHENTFFQRIDGALSKHGFFATLVLVVIPFVPIDSVTIVAAITRISFSDFLLGISVGSIVTILPYIFLGDMTTRSGFGMMLLGFLLMLLITFWAWRHPHFRGFFRKK